MNQKAERRERRDLRRAMGAGAVEAVQQHAQAIRVLSERLFVVEQAIERLGTATAGLERRLADMERRFKFGAGGH